jgi:uncharacterized membrane protein
MHYFPLAWPFLLALGALFLLVVALVELRLLRYAYERMGVPPRYVLGVLLLTLLGSAVNLPVAELPEEQMVDDQVVTAFGVRYVIPEVRERPGTVIAVNVGGALIPALLSVYLLVQNRLYLRGLLAVFVVAAAVHFMARPVRGLGITVPTFAPPLIAAAVALALAWEKAAPLAYVGGTLGTLTGADLLNLGQVRGLGAPVASIGGAGTFDAVFLTGILAVVLTFVAGPTPPRAEEAR